MVSFALPNFKSVMKIKIVLTLVVVFLTNIVYAQSVCECSNALELLIKKIESDYPGFEEKTKDKILVSVIYQEAVLIQFSI